MPYQLPPLPYAYEALEPFIDAETMHLHHDKHHQTYLNKLNEALELHPEIFKENPEDMLRNLDLIPEDIRTTVRNHGGGYVNHAHFWQSMTPDSSLPTGDVADAINQTFGTLEHLQKEFSNAGAAWFGSGWVWLVKTANAELQIMTTQNQDSPLSQGLIPLIGNDLWEHAYYLQYQNRRADYLAAWWNIVNWKEAERRFSE